MYLRFQSQPGGTAKTVSDSVVATGESQCLLSVRAVPQLYIFINDAADRVVEAIRVDTRYH